MLLPMAAQGWAQSHIQVKAKQAKHFNPLNIKLCFCDHFRSPDQGVVNTEPGPSIWVPCGSAVQLGHVCPNLGAECHWVWMVSPQLSLETTCLLSFCNEHCLILWSINLFRLQYCYHMPYACMSAVYTCFHRCVNTPVNDVSIWMIILTVCRCTHTMDNEWLMHVLLYYVHKLSIACLVCVQAWWRWRWSECWLC